MKLTLAGTRSPPHAGGHCFLGERMIGLVLVTHGALAIEFKAALEHVVGPQELVETVCIGPDDDMEARRNDI